VDLTVELDDSDWAKLGVQLQTADAPVSEAGCQAPVNQDDAVWEPPRTCCARPQMTGPELLGA
jgi:hypothetical protein